MKTQEIPAGVIHDLPSDVRTALTGNATALAAWHDITPLARNEWLCWVESAKLIETRAKRVERLHTELAEGKRRPCCWIGCIHRTDKAISPSVQWVLDRQSKSKS